MELGHFNQQATINNQLGFDISGGGEAAVHASRVCLKHLPSDYAVVKVDFRNAFNSIRRDRVLRTVKEYIPDLLPFAHSSYIQLSIDPHACGMMP